MAPSGSVAAESTAALDGSTMWGWICMLLYLLSCLSGTTIFGASEDMASALHIRGSPRGGRSAAGGVRDWGPGRSSATCRRIG